MVLSCDSVVDELDRRDGDDLESPLPFGSFLHHLAGPAVLRDAFGRHVWVNPAARALAARFGTPEPVGVPLADMGYGESFLRRQQELDRRVLAGEPSIAVALEVDDPVAGERLWLTCSWFATWHPRLGTLVGVVMVDTTERHRARVEAERLRSQLSAFLEHSPTAAAVKDERGRYQYVNNAFRRLHSLTDDEVIGKTVHDLLGPDVGAAFAEEERATLRTGRPRRFVEVVRPGGEVVHTAGCRFPVPGPGGRTWLGVVFLDVTELREAQQRASEAVRRHDDLFHRNAVAVLITDLDRRVLDANQACSAASGYSVSELRALEPGALTSPASDALIREHVDEVVAGRRKCFSTPLTAVGKNGDLAHVQVTATLVPGHGDRPPVLYWIVLPDRLPDTARRLGNDPVDLSPLDNRMIEMLAVGKSNAEIGRELRLSRTGMDYRLTRLRDKLRAPSRTAIATRAYALGLISPGTWPPVVHAGPEAAVRSA